MTDQAVAELKGAVLRKNATCNPLKCTTPAVTDLRDLLRDVVRSVFDLGRDDGFLRGGRRGGLLLVGLGEVERDQRDLVDGAVLVQVGVRGGAQQAGF